MPALLCRPFFRGFLLLLVFVLTDSCSRERKVTGFDLQPEGWIGGEGKLGAKATVVDFWATWCAPCLRAMPELIEWQRKYGPKGLQVIGVAGAEIDVASDTIRPTLQKFLAQKFPDLNFPIAYDSSPRTSEKWQVEALPTQFVLSAKGEIVFAGRGPEVEEAMLKELGLPMPVKAPAPTRNAP